MTLGLKTVRELCLRCPLVMGDDLLQDLALYKKYRNKEVSHQAVPGAVQFAGARCMHGCKKHSSQVQDSGGAGAVHWGLCKPCSSRSSTWPPPRAA